MFHEPTCRSRRRWSRRVTRAPSSLRGARLGVGRRCIAEKLFETSSEISKKRRVVALGGSASRRVGRHPGLGGRVQPRADAGQVQVRLVYVAPQVGERRGWVEAGRILELEAPEDERPERGLGVARGRGRRRHAERDGERGTRREVVLVVVARPRAFADACAARKWRTRDFFVGSQTAVFFATLQKNAHVFGPITGRSGAQHSRRKFAEMPRGTKKSNDHDGERARRVRGARGLPDAWRSRRVLTGRRGGRAAGVGRRARPPRRGCGQPREERRFRERAPVPFSGTR